MTAYEMRISDWSSYVCASDLDRLHQPGDGQGDQRPSQPRRSAPRTEDSRNPRWRQNPSSLMDRRAGRRDSGRTGCNCRLTEGLPMPTARLDGQVTDIQRPLCLLQPLCAYTRRGSGKNWGNHRSDEHTSELQSLMRNSYAVFYLK